MIKLKTLIEVLLSLLLARILIKGASIGDSLAFISLVGCYSFKDFLKFKEKVLEQEKKEDPNRELIERLEFIEEKTNKFETKLGAATLSMQRLR